MTHRIRATTRVVAIAAPLLLAACGFHGASGTSAVKATVRVGFVVDPTWAQVPVAQAEKLFSKEGVDVKVVDFDSGPAALEALSSGRIDVATSADVPVAAAVIHNPDFRIIADGSQWPGQRIVARKSGGVRTIADLNGKTIGVPLGTSAQYYIDAALQAHPDIKVKLVNVSPSEIVSAILRHSVDAISIFDPFQTQVEQALGKDAVVLGDAAYDQQGLYLSTTARIAANRAGIARFLDALRMADSALAGESAVAMNAVGNATGLQLAVVKPVTAGFRYEMDLPQSLPAQLASLGEWGVRVGHIPASVKLPDYVGFVDQSLLPK